MSKIQIYHDKTSQSELCWRWRLNDSNGDQIAESRNASAKSKIKGIIKKFQYELELVKTIASEVGLPQQKGKFTFQHLKHDNDDENSWDILFDSNEVFVRGIRKFSSHDRVIVDINKFIKIVITAEIEFENHEDDPSHEAHCQDDTKDNPTIPPGS